MKCIKCGWKSRDVTKIYVAEWGKAEPLCEECMYDIAKDLRDSYKSQIKNYSQQPEDLSARGDSEDNCEVSAYGDRIPADTINKSGGKG